MQARSSAAEIRIQSATACEDKLTTRRWPKCDFGGLIVVAERMLVTSAPG